MEEQTKPAKTKSTVSATACSNCGTTSTPLWRRAPNGNTICNACGLYLKAKNTLRPPTMARSRHSDLDTLLHEGTCPGNGQCNGTGGSPSCAGCPAFNQHQTSRHTLMCANCRTTTTPLWRRDNQANTICNACGLYYKLHNVHRPVSMKRAVIQRRMRVVMSEKKQNNIDDDDDEQDELVSSDEETTASPHVPAIEDYVGPTRWPSSSSSWRLLPPPPITQRFDPLLDYRAPRPHHNNKDSPYQDLSDFDEAMTRLERLRRRVLPEQGRVLSKLTSELEDIVEKAQDILDGDNTKIQ